MVLWFNGGCGCDCGSGCGSGPRWEIIGNWLESPTTSYHLVSQVLKKSTKLLKRDSVENTPHSETIDVPHDAMQFNLNSSIG